MNIRLFPGAVVIFIFLILFTVLLPKKEKKQNDTTSYEIRNQVDGTKLIIPSGDTEAAWECDSFDHSLTYTRANGNVLKIYIATRVTVLGTKQAISINGKQPPGDDWTKGTIIDVTGDRNGLHIVIQEAAEESFIVLPWP